MLAGSQLAKQAAMVLLSNVPMYGAIAVNGISNIACSVGTFLKNMCQETGVRTNQRLK